MDTTGQRFGRLVALEMAPYHVQPCGLRVQCWRCRCDCGEETVVQLPKLRAGRTKSCGCIRSNMTARLKLSHGLHGAPEYKVWKSMRARCKNPVGRSARYAGITVCDRWNDFTNFLEDMGHRPSPDHSIDRIDNDGNYEPDNCRWATPSEQMNNRSTWKNQTWRGRPVKGKGDALLHHE